MQLKCDVIQISILRCTDDFNGAQLKAVCVEAGKIALRRKAEELAHTRIIWMVCVCVCVCVLACWCEWCR